MNRPISRRLRTIAASLGFAALLGFTIWIASQPPPQPAPPSDGREGEPVADGGRPADDPFESEGSGESVFPVALDSKSGFERWRDNAPSRPRVLVRGIVVRERSDVPIAGARITVLSRIETTIGGPRSLFDAEHPQKLDDLRVIELTSQNDGTFEWNGPVSPPTEGEFGFGARARGFGARIGSFPAIDAAHAIARIELRPEAIIRGRVSRESGRPMPGTRVDVYCGVGRQDDAWWRDRQSLATRTGADGEYELREIDVGPGGWTTSVDFRSFTGGAAQTHSVPIQLEPGATREVDWTAVEADGKPRGVSTLVGHVRERDGTPIAGASVEFRQRVPVAKGWAGYTPTASAKSDSAGSFTLHSSASSKASETFVVRVGAVGFVTVSLRYRGEERGPVEVSLDRAHPQEGVVTRPDGTPARDVRVAFFLTGERVDAETNRKPPPVEQVQTDPDGRFRARSLGDGPHDVEVDGDLRMLSVPRQPLLRITLESATGETSDR